MNKHLAQDYFLKDLDEKLGRIINGLWTVNVDEFHVQIEINSSDYINKKYYQNINQNELAAIQNQIHISSLESQNYLTFSKIIYPNILHFQKIIQYLNLQGIEQFKSIQKKKFQSLVKVFGDINKFIDNEKFSFKNIYESCPKTKFISNNIQHYAFRIIGQIIQTQNDPYNDLQPYIKCILGTYISFDSFQQCLRSNFMPKITNPEILFDSCRLGQEFCLFFSNPSNIPNNFHCNLPKRIKKIYSDKSAPKDFFKKLKISFNKNNTLFFKVIRPSHCYHCILSLARIIFCMRNKPVYLNEKTLIFCQKGGNFADQINLITETNNNSNVTYFVIHPENLNKEDHSLLVDFLNSRLKSNPETIKNKVFIISSIYYSEYFNNIEINFNSIEFQIDSNLISFLYKLSFPENPDINNYHLYYSDKAGAGKTYHIYKDFKGKTNELKSYFLDVSMKKMPSIKVNNISESYVHFDLSSDLFDNDFCLFDDLWIFTIMNYHIKSDGTNMKTPHNIIFEVPTLTKKQYQEGGFIHDYDFPIYVDNYHKISNESHDIIMLSDKVKYFVKMLFESSIETTSQLLKTAARLFYKDFHFNDIDFVPRTLNEMNSFLNTFSQNLNVNDKLGLPIFLLLLRSVFHIVDMESIFDKTKEQPKSFVIMANRNLFSNKPDRNKWALLCFHSIDEHNEWNTSFLNQRIREKIGKIGDFSILENDFFKILKNCDNIEIYSNQLNYFDNQAYFFQIIRSFFYHNEDKNTKYCRIMDGVILNHFKQWDCFEKLENSLTCISQGQESYESNKKVNEIQKWTFLIGKISQIFQRYENQPLDTIDELTNNDMVKAISKITLTMMHVKMFIIMIIRIILKQATIFEGFTGVGKTLIIQLLKLLISIVQINQIDDNGFKWSYQQFDCHGALQLNEVINKINTNVFSSKQEGMNQIFFFDELNTSSVSSYIINEMTSNYLRKNLENDQKQIVFIAAINQYIKISKFARSISRVGIKQIIPKQESKLNLCSVPPRDISNFYEYYDLNKLAYNVRELPESSKMLVLKSDPEFFLFNEDDLSKMKKGNCSQLYPPDESKTVYNIIRIYLNNLEEQTKFENTKNLLKIKISTKENFDVIHKTVVSFKKQIANIIHSLLSKSFIKIRQLMQLRSVLSYRDVKRSMQFFIHFFRKLINVFSSTVNEEILVNEIIPQSIVLSIMISIIFRFSDETKFETTNGFLNSSAKKEEMIIRRCKEFGLTLKMSNDRTYVEVNIRSALLKILNEIEWSKQIKKPADWMKIVTSYSWLKCSKYVYNFKKDDHYSNSSLFKLNTLMFNLFAISSCYSASKGEKQDSLIPLLIIGMPGTSKTLAIEKFIDYKQKRSKNKNNFFSTTYLSTKISEEESLSLHYQDCASFMLSHENSTSVCVIDELGLANLNEKRPLKLLHYYFDKGILMKSDDGSILVPVMSIAASNYATDYSNMNRGILISTDLPTDEDIAESFYLSELEVSKYVINAISLREFKKKYFMENGFFNWKIESPEKVQKYKYFLSELWKLTSHKQRPERLTLRPIFLLFNSIFHNSGGFDDCTVYNLCLYLVSAISCSPSDSYDILKTLINNINDGSEEIKYLLSKIIDEKLSNFIAFKQIFNGTPNSTNFQLFKKIVNEHSDECHDIHGIVNDENGFNQLREILNVKNEPSGNFKKLVKISEQQIFNPLTKKVNDTAFDSYKLLKQKIKEKYEYFTKRAFCFKTKNNECLDFIEELLRKTTTQYSKNIKNEEIQFHKIFPSDFKVDRQITMNESIDKIIDLITDKNKNILHYVLIIGNATIVDALLDLLNTPNESKASLTIKKKPLISRSGFSIQLDEYPSNIVFCFVINEKDLNNRNSADSFPVPLLDRINQFYFDYDQRDEFGIIEKYQKIRNQASYNLIPLISIVRQYFNCFVSQLTNIEIPKDPNTIVVVFATTDITASNHDYFHRDSKAITDIKYLGKEIDYKFDKKILLLTVWPSYLAKTCIVNKNLRKLETEAAKKGKKLIYYWSNEYDKLYELKSKNKLNIPFPYPENYKTLLDYNYSINKLIKSKSQHIQNKPFKAIILTLSIMMEEINFENGIVDGIDKQSTDIIYDSHIYSQHDFESRIDKNKNSIIIRSNQYQNEHDRHLRIILDQEKYKSKKNLIIIYHMKSTEIPEGLYSSADWPVYWLESISYPLFSNYEASKIVDCILFKDVFDAECKNIVKILIRKKYEELILNYKFKFDEDKAENILEFISKYSNLKLSVYSFEKLRNSLKSTETSNFYIDLNKRFFDIISDQLPQLTSLIRMLILNCKMINYKDINETEKFLTKLFFGQSSFNFKELQSLFKISEIEERKYDQFDGYGIYFPELILPQIEPIFNQFMKAEKQKAAGEEPEENYSFIDEKTIEIFNNLQSNQSLDNNINSFCNNYLIEYAKKILNNPSATNYVDKFILKLNELLYKY